MSNHNSSQSIWPGLTSASPGNVRSINLEPKPRYSKLGTGDKTQSGWTSLPSDSDAL